MKVVLVAVDSKFIHSNLAVKYLKAYTDELDYDCNIMEFSINDRVERIVQEIIFAKPNMVSLSCYIWNINYIKQIAALIKLINPNIKILYGGPEVSYDSETFLKENVGEYLIEGEGEETFREFIECTIKNKSYKGIKGLYYKEDDKIEFAGSRELMDLNKLKFPYSKDDDLSNKIVYFESSRGCPFKCKYCLSSTIRGVRFLNIDRVKQDLKFLVDKKVKLIKFVDRTFNCNSKFAMEIWEYLMSLDTDATFHFEISADILSEEQLDLLKKAPKGRFQFEVGVQTTNDDILKNINRFVSFKDIRKQVEKLNSYGNIKQHLDLIAGLPGEDFQSFKKSFNDLYSIKPDEIQLGFLKVLKGSPMEKEANEWGIVYSPYPPYEVLKTNDISYEELMTLKRVEEMVDKYYNSRKFNLILKYFVSKFEMPFEFYLKLGDFCYKKGYFARNLSSTDYYKVFLEFNEEELKEDSFYLKEIIKYDYLRFNKRKWLPEFLNREKIKEEERTIKEEVDNGNIKVSKQYHAEKFFIDIKAYMDKGELKKSENYIIFDGDETIIYNKI